ncbi:MAG TPA: DUF1501 domain-containing protein [Pirellulales bacterium]
MLAIDGSRRNFLRRGALGLGALGLADVLRLQAQADAPRKQIRAVIMVCLPGGPSHLDMYDMKPRAPAEVRGEFRPIATNVPGIEYCEHLPLQATIADKLAIVRNMRFTQPDHQLHEVYTGFPTSQQRPAFGSVVSRLYSGPPNVLPHYMSLSLSDHPRTVAKAEVPTYLGLTHGPFEPTGEGMKNLTPDDGLSQARLAQRAVLLGQLDPLAAPRGDRALESAETFKTQALQLISSKTVRAAFDLSREPEAVRQLYGPDVQMQFDYQFGRTWHSSNFLLARRLVEAGVPVVTLGEGGWDHHGNVSGVKGTIFERSREETPLFDRSLYALVTDLHLRGLDRDVAVVVWGEFGRNPHVNQYGGRDHWPSAGFALFAGGGFRTGQLVGATDAIGAHSTTPPYGPQNVLATLYRHLRIDPHQTLVDFTGRPRALLDDAQPIQELV